MDKSRRNNGKLAAGRGDAAGLRIVIASDWAPIRALESLVSKDPEAVYGDLLPVLGTADLRIVNCECALTGARRPVWKSGAVFKGLPKHAGGLTAVSFDVACLANNHVFDYGLAGFEETLAVLRRNGIQIAGAGMTFREATAPLPLTIGGQGVTVVNFSEGEDLTASSGGPGVCGWEIDRLAAEIRQAKKRGDFVVAVGHAGLEYIPFPPPYVVRAFRALSDAGADCVAGHHPHVPQGVEVRGGRLIAYSLGNFVFWQPGDLYYRRTGFLLELEVGNGRLVSHRLHPYRITPFGLRSLGKDDDRRFRRAVEGVSQPLRSAKETAEAWQSYLAFYGLEGFRKEVLTILGRMDEEPRKGAAMFRNRLTTLQHTELWRDVLTRSMSDKPPAPRPAWTRLVREWLTKPVSPKAG